MVTARRQIESAESALAWAALAILVAWLLLDRACGQLELARERHDAEVLAQLEEIELTRAAAGDAGEEG